MQSAAVPCTGIKRTAASAMLSDNSQTCAGAPSSSAEPNFHPAANSQSISPEPPEKRSYIVVESPLKLETIASAEDLDIKVLRIQNKNLSERLIQRQKLEAELREKIDALQNRKLTDDNKICIIDRYWTQLDEDLRLMLERFDETAASSNNDDTEKAEAKNSKSSSNKNNKENNLGVNKSGAQSLRNFLSKLNEWDKVEIEENLKERVKFTTQTVAKLMNNYDRITKRTEQYFKELTHGPSGDKIEEKVNELRDDNNRLNDLITKNQSKTHSFGIEKKQFEDQIAILESEIKELNSKNDEIEYELEKTRDKAFKLDRQLADTLKKLNSIQKSANLGVTSHMDQNGHIIFHNNLNQNSRSGNVVSDKQLTDIEKDLEEQKELAASRLSELEKLNTEYQNSLKQIEKLKADLKLMPESVIEQSNEYRMLQTKFSLVVNDNIKLKQALDESKNLLEMSRVTFQRHIEQMESEELAQQKRLCSEMMELKEQLIQIRKENEHLRIEYEQNVAANEQTGPINKEMRSLITTLQTNNKLLKSDNVRTKKRLEEHLQEIDKLKKQITQLSQLSNVKKESETTTLNAGSAKVVDDKEVVLKAEIKCEPVEAKITEPNFDKESQKDQQIKELKEQNRKLTEAHKDLKSLLEIYTKSNKQQSPAATCSNTPSKHKLAELDEAKCEIKRLKDSLDKYKCLAASAKIVVATQQIPSNSSPSSHNHHHHQHHHHHHSSSSSSTSSQHHEESSGGGGSLVNDYIKKVKSLEETIRELHKSLASKKQEETALLNDMEITGQAFEDMQEQNVRLMQQLREKDDANFKLVSERIKLENTQKILAEEKEIYAQQAVTLQEQLETQMLISKKLEEQLHMSNQSTTLCEKEIAHWQQACENYRRQAVDNVQFIQDLKLNTQKYLSQLKEVQQQIAEKSESLAAQSFANKRAQEEIKHLHAKLERQKKFEMASSMDDVLKEEIKEYKEQLRCPSCKVKQKDAVLTKCFHVFCFDCLQKRYESRQRKCPKCNANFGANDYRKLYLS